MADLGNAWENTVDNGEWIVRVERKAPYLGELVVIRASDNTEILREEVGIAFDAVFGPDVADVDLWQRRCVEVIDAQDN